MTINMYSLIASEVFDGGPSAKDIPILRKWLSSTYIVEPYSSAFLHCMKEIVMKTVSVNMVIAKSIEKNSIHVSFKMFVKLLTDVNGLYILLVSAEMA